jgi:hypothetical protein
MPRGFFTRFSGFVFGFNLIPGQRFLVPWCYLDRRTAVFINSPPSSRFIRYNKATLTKSQWNHDPPAVFCSYVSLTCELGVVAVSLSRHGHHLFYVFKNYCWHMKSSNKFKWKPDTRARFTSMTNHKSSDVLIVEMCIRTQWQMGGIRKEKITVKNFSRRDCIRKFSYHEIFRSFVSEEIPK